VDIGWEVWASVNSTVSPLFPRPATGQSVVKVINHYGDEVMKVVGT
jgi:adenine-specific DNA-methyltransferase